MLKKILLLLLIVSILFASNSNEVLAQKQANTKLINAYHHFKDAIDNNQTFENYAHFAHSAYFYGDLFVTENIKKREIFQLGRDAAANAIKLNNNNAIGYFVYGINTSKLARYSNNQEKLIYLKETIEALNKAIELNPEFGKEHDRPGTAYLLRAVVYSKAPTPPVSIGDDIQAEKDFKKALELGHENRQVYRFYGEYLLNKKRNTEALQIIDSGIALKYNPAVAIDEEIELGLLKKLKEDLQQNN